jgi:polyhydroxyalkanoate synthesis regulator phasin
MATSPKNRTKKPQKSPARKAPSRRADAKKRVREVVSQVKEPLSLLSTLREEGLANAMALLDMASSVASGATRGLRVDALKPQIRELVSSMGFALSSDVEKLEARVEELEQKISEKEFAEIRGHDEE